MQLIVFLSSLVVDLSFDKPHIVDGIIPRRESLSVSFLLEYHEKQSSKRIGSC